MDSSAIKIAGQIAGIGGIALIAFLWIFRDIIRKDIFSKLTKQHSYQIFRLIIIITGIIALAGIIAWLYVNKKEQLADNSAVLTGPSPVITPNKSLENLPPTPQATISRQSISPVFKQPSPIISTEAYEIIGHVIDGTYEGATIESAPVFGAAITIRNRQTGEEFKATSDNWGKFSKMLPAGSYKVMATHLAYSDESNTCIVSRETISTPCKIVFTHKKDDTSELGAITGTVLDEQGQLLADVHVILKSKVKSTQAQDDYTATSGNFHFYDVTHGEYYITFQHAKYKEKTIECNTQKGMRCQLHVRLPKDNK